MSSLLARVKCCCQSHTSRHQMTEVPLEKFQDDILLFSCNKVALAELQKAEFPAESFQMNCSIMKNKYLIPCQSTSAMACLLCTTPVHYKRLNSLELTNLQKSSKSGLVTAEPLNPDYICQSWLHDFSSHSLALCQSILSHHPQITFIFLFLDVVSGMLTFPSAKFWWTWHIRAGSKMF